MKAVLALALLCVLQVSMAQQQAEDSLSLSEATGLLDREAREARKSKGKKQGNNGSNKAKQSRKKSKGKKQGNNGSNKAKQSRRKSKGKKQGNNGSNKAKQSRRKSKGKKQGNNGSNKAKQSRRKSKGKKQGNNGSNKAKQSRRKSKGKKQGNNGSNKAKQSRSSDVGRQAATCLADVLGKTKKFNKVQTELRMVNRIVSWKKTISGKKENAANNTFGDALAALDESTNGGKECGEDGSEDADTKKIHDKLKGCGASAGSKCDISNITLPTEALLTECKTLLAAFSIDFKKCLTGDSATASATQCTCIQGLTVPKDACLDNAAARNDLLAQKNKCTKGTEEGSFGDCRKAEREAAKAANKCRPKTGCTRPNKPTMTTGAPSGRVNFLKQLSQRHLKFNLH